MREKKSNKNASSRGAEKMQYIEIEHLLGHKSYIEVHPSRAYEALNHYRRDISVKSARIVTTKPETKPRATNNQGDKVVGRRSLKEMILEEVIKQRNSDPW